ncbi:hypothetical protein N7466_005018 [Penicillium verhagenii]|uniref:uncharacterized protein n=1 Tax=Penicillium verhagenii TaxID=1562060 RepID=UPI00254501AA|nr:uncharacterized protein N7466_005018 [Penicillium verhagenii]KAJ5935471.1 hypothetical protein N7466_005018 [Penicillium verhagenii]
MKFLTIASLTLLLAGAQAAPSTPFSKKSPAVIFDKRSSINDCGTSTFTNESSSGSPEVADCRKIATNIKSGGTWTFEGFGVHHQLVQYGTCAFGVKVSADRYTYIGNEDIIQLIDDSIKKFKWEGKVGAKGTMKCSGQDGDDEVVWGIYKT